MKEVIRKEGDKWVLYSSDGKKKMGTFDTKEQAQKRERQIQFFKHKASARRLTTAELVERKKHTTAWHRCWEKVKGKYNDRSAAAICTWSVQRPPNPPGVYEAIKRQLAEAEILLSLDDAHEIDEILAAEMELRGITAIMIDTESWEIAEIFEDGSKGRPEEPVPAEQYTERHEAVRQVLVGRGLLEIGGRHTRREFQIIEEVIRLMVELHGEVEDLETLLNQVEEAAGRPNVADVLESEIHRSFTYQADDLFRRGRIDRQERISLSGFIGDALTVFAERMDAELPDLRIRLPWEEDQEGRPIYASAGSNGSRPLADTWDRSLTEARIDEQGNLSGVIVVEGLSANGNYYTREALESGVEVFAGKPIYADHPTRTEERERPERSVRDLVGRLPGAGGLSVEVISETDPRLALKYHGGRLSETAGWLATLIRERIAGDQSINASGRGRDQEGQFIVEAFTGATSLDFVTQAAAGGHAQLAESQDGTGSQRRPIEEIDLSKLTFEQFVEARPDIVNDVASREKRKAYGEKARLQALQEAFGMATKKEKELEAENIRLKQALAKVQHTARRQRANELVGGVLAESGLPAQAQTRVRRLVEVTVRRFVEQEGEEAPPQTEPPGELAPVGTDLSRGEAPTVELPPDVAELPEEAQALWLETYTGNLADGEETAVHKAWSAVYASGWLKDETSGEWFKMEPEPPAEELPAAPPMEALTEEALQKAVRQAVLAERQYLARVSGAGRIAGMGAGQTGAQQEQQIEEQRVKAFMNMGLTEAEARIAVKGR